MWSGVNFQFETIIQSHETPVRAMAFTHNGNFLVSGDDGGTVGRRGGQLGRAGWRRGVQGWGSRTGWSCVSSLLPRARAHFLLLLHY